MMKDGPAKGLTYGFFPYLALMDGIINSMGGKDFKDVGKKVSGSMSDLWKGLTGQTSAEAYTKANERNIENQNYWNEVTMAREDTAHQREMADLQAAGLNPWLSVSGTGASAGTLQTATAEPEDGSKILQATSAMALLAITKLLLKK